MQHKVHFAVCQSIRLGVSSIQMVKRYFKGFPQALEIMENLEIQEKKFHAWKNHGF